MSEQATYTEHVYQEYSCGSFVDPLHQREEIVRCMDCKHYNKHKWFDIVPGTPLGSDISDVCMFFSSGVKVEPGGFCKWGERREQ